MNTLPCLSAISSKSDRFWNFLFAFLDNVALPNWLQKAAHMVLNSLTTKKQITKFLSANFQKMLSPSCIILRIQRLEGKQCRSRWGGSL